MKVKTFYAVTMQDAMRMIKEELGPDAIILSSKEVRQGGRMLRLFNRPVLEVMAASEEDLPRMMWPRHEEAATSNETLCPVAPAALSLETSGFQATLQSMLKPAASFPKPPVPLADQRQSQGRSHRLRQLRDELVELSHLLGKSLPVETQSSDPEAPTALAQVLRSFVQQGMRPSTAEMLGNDIQQRQSREELGNEDVIRQALQQVLADRIRVSGPFLAERGGRTVALILGPSGAGKTSMVTKLAAQYRLEQSGSVAVVTFDSCREVSIEQLRRYAKALGVPFASARSPRQLHEGLRRLARADLVLIDVPGLGPEDLTSAKELHDLLGGECEMSTHLVLPVATRERDLQSILHRVNELPDLHLIFTKLDETSSFGTIFDVAYQNGVPLSYWGVGQRVPEDIEVASHERLAEFLMAQRYVMQLDPMGRRKSLPRESAMPEAVGSVYTSNEW